MNRTLINKFKKDFINLTEKELKLKSIRYYAALLDIPRSQVWSTFETLKRFNVIRRAKPNSNYTLLLSNFQKMFGISEYSKVEKYLKQKAKKVNVKTELIANQDGYQTIVFHREIFFQEKIYSLSIDIIHHTKVDPKHINQGFHNLIRHEICHDHCIMSVTNKVINIQGILEYKKLQQKFVILQETKIIDETTDQEVSYSLSLIPLEFYSDSYIKIF